MSEVLTSTRSGYHADVTIGDFKLRLLSYKGGKGWLGKVIDLKSLTYPFKAHPATDAEHGKVIALQLARVYTGQLLPEVKWERTPTGVNDN